jgi:hypothetical protein
MPRRHQQVPQAPQGAGGSERRMGVSTCKGTTYTVCSVAAWTAWASIGDCVTESTT